ncbi:tRNA-specific 2-thiouridylase [Mycena floridula]|nr:tRNA-specific 2-thiouridylase [Mycena floridula]
MVRLVAPLRYHYAARTLPKPGERVVVAMSGGVDSAVAAKLLADQDLDLSAVFMRNWDTRDESGSDKGCEWEHDWQDVQLVCKALDIPCQMVDLSRQYWTRVFGPALDAWAAGQTPNPDVWCNREIKFGALFDHLGPDSPFLATGHYARKSWSPETPTAPSRPKLLSSKDTFKDQTYYLSSITEQGLSRALFPVGGLLKSEVRELARQYRLPTAARPESMGLCFVGEKARFNSFLGEYLPANPGPFIDLESGKTIGQHTGLWNYTIGQNARVANQLEKMYVSRKDPSSNSVFVVTGQHPSLRLNHLVVSDWTWIWQDSPPVEITNQEGFRSMVKLRHCSQKAPCTVYKTSQNELEIILDDPEHGISPGQVAALWDGDWCLGCGTIRDAK